VNQTSDEVSIRPKFLLFCNNGIILYFVFCILFCNNGDTCTGYINKISSSVIGKLAKENTSILGIMRSVS